MRIQAKELQNFFYSQAFADGFRTAFAVLLPALAGSYFGFFSIGLTLSLGAMCVSLTDAPGPVVHRKNGMLICAGFVFLVAFITAHAQRNVYTMGLEIAVVTFFFSMFTIYGNRATSVGNAAILVMILTMESALTNEQILPHALSIFAGGIYYLVLSLLLHTIRPYRIAQRALGDCVWEIANYLSIKADFYNPATDLDNNYKRLVAQQIIVNEKQDAVRELFFKTRQIVRETTAEGRRLVLTFVETVDLFEDITASYYDYALLRKQFSHTGALELISASLKKLVVELEAIGMAIQSNTSYSPGFNYDDELRQLKAKIDAIAQRETANTVILKKILVNFRRMLLGLKELIHYFDKDIKRNRAALDHSHFVSHQSLDPKIFWNNLSFESSVFKHALRVCIACLTGFVVSKLLAYGHHSYWILMTIAFMLKPAFSLTKQRNIERITGTLAGGALGVLILVFIPNKTVQFFFMVIFMIGTYSFMRIRYLLMVICTTPYILILFSFLGTGYRSVVQERVFDTVLGCAIALSAGYLLFPSWESHQLKNYVHGLLRANAAYLEKIIQALSGQDVSLLEYKLARKDVYLNSANLAAAFQRMISEPKSKQKNSEQAHEFVVLSHILFSNIATVATSLLAKEPRKYPHPIIALARKSYVHLQETADKLEGKKTPPPQKEKAKPPGEEQEIASADDALLKDQLSFIYRLTGDLDKTAREIINRQS